MKVCIVLVSMNTDSGYGFRTNKMTPKQEKNRDFKLKRALIIFLKA